MKPILKLPNNIVIFADSNGYSVRIDSKLSYFSNLEMCFKEIFDQTLKRRLIENDKKNIEEILKIVKEVKKEIENLWKDSDKYNIELPKPRK